MMDFLDKERIKNHFRRTSNIIEDNQSIILTGTITQISGMKIEASGISIPLGTVCKILVSKNVSVNAEVIGFSEKSTYLMATEDVSGIKQGTRVVSLSNIRHARVGISLLGRVLDATGNPIDDGEKIVTNELYPLIAKPINPLLRRKISEPLDVGIRAINALLTVGKGQRIGIFAGSGIGKSVLLGMMTRFTKAHIVVVGLVGERGREVKEFIEESLGKAGLKKSIVVASPADTSPLLRSNCAALATTIAEYYRDKGFDVLLIIDSLTRYAQALREMSLAVGELPATKGFTPSVFAKLSQLVERSGNGSDQQGSITAFYTILMEGDDHADPIADHARSVLDGHIFLSRPLADAGHYPAIDVGKSISRVMNSVITDEQLNYSTKFKKLYSAYAQNRDLVNVGMYQHGSDKLIDESIKYKDQMENFLKQQVNESSSHENSVMELINIFAQ